MIQSFFAVKPMIVASGGTNYNWTDIDLSAYIAVGATGAIVRIKNTSPGVRPWGIRKKGSSDTRQASMSGSCHCWGIIGVDTNRKLQFYNQNVNPDKCELWLVGYTLSGVTMLNNGTLLTSGAPTGVWTDIDLSSLIPIGSIGAICEVHITAGGLCDWGQRCKGSTDNRIYPTENQKNQFCAITAVNTDRFIQVYRSIANGHFWLLGYITEGALFYLNGQDMGAISVGSWQDFTPLETGGVVEGYKSVAGTTFYRTGIGLGDGGIAFIEIGGSASDANAGVRRNLSADDFKYSINQHIFAITGGAGKLKGGNIPSLLVAQRAI